MKTRTFASAAILASLALLSSIPAHALGLGTIELSSALNEPFKAEIQVSSLGDKEAGNLQVQLASNEEFERAGLEKTSALRDLKFEIVERNGATIIAITSKKPFREPLVDFLISATTGTGHLIREYTVLLDPPKSVFKQKSSAPIPAKAPVQKIKQPTNPTEYQSTQPSFTPQSATKYGPVRNSDTLWNIALKTRPEKTVTVHQMMMALLKENGSAFINNNINGLKAGVTLAIPNNAAINALTAKQAQAAVGEQNTLWKNRNRTKASTESAIADSANQIVAVAEEETVSSESPSATQVAESQSRLKLLSPNKEDSAIAEDEFAGLGDAKVAALSEQLTLAQQTIEQQAQENIDIKARVAEMEQQIETLRKLIAIDDPELAKLQGKLEQEDTIADDDPALEKLSEEIISALESDQHLAEVTELESEPAEAGKVEEVAAAVQDAATNTEQKPGAENKAEPEQAEPVGLFEQVKALLADYKIEAMSAGLVFLIALLLLARRGGGAGGSRGKTWDEAVKEIGGEEPLPNFTGSQNREALSSEPVAEQAESEEPKPVDEMIQDADAFTSYGDLEQAKLTLEEVLKEEPGNHAAIHKLLFVLFRQQNSDEFVPLAERFEIDHDSLEWAEIQEWGRELDPEHELFKAAAEPVEDEEVVEEQEEAEPVEEQDTAESEPLEFDVAEETSAAETDEVIDLDLSADDDQSVDDELLAFSTDSEATDDSQEDTAELDLESSEEGVEQPESEGMELDFTEELSEVTDEELELANKALSGETEPAEVELDLDDVGQIDEAETKLDLASAYIDMGDTEGARAILEEVLNEGNDEQKERAQNALNDLN